MIITSNNIAQCFCRRILSPLARVKSLLSSMTEFMFSTHNASTSPSYTMYFLSFLSVGLLISLKIFERSPSVQSRVTGSRIPYRSITDRSLGLITNNLVGTPNLNCKVSEHLFRHLVSMLHTITSLLFKNTNYNRSLVFSQKVKDEGNKTSGSILKLTWSEPETRCWWPLTFLLQWVLPP